MTIAKEFAAKLAVALVAVAMVLSAFAPAAQAQTTEELQAMINDLLAQVAALSAQTGQGGTSASGVCPYTWTRSLTMGSTGSDVMKLQQFLNADPDTRVAASGVGSVGAETEYYGALTAAAVSKFQVKYLSEILTPVGLVSPTGYFGPSTMAKANAECVSAPVVVPPVVDDTTMDDDDTTMDDDDTMDDDSDNGPLSGEASLNTFEVDDPDDDTVQEGQDDVEIGSFTVEFTDGDAEVSRLDVALQGGDDETDPWDTFETISLWVDGDKIAEENADDRDDWLDEDNGEMRFSGLDLIGREDDEFVITVAATIQNGIDDGNDGEDWSLYAVAMRYFDADGVATTDTDTDDIDDAYGGSSADFTIEQEGGDDELVVSSSSDDPDGTTLALEDDSDSDWITVFIFEMDTDDSDNDITLNTVPVSVELSSSTYTAVVDDAELIIDGETISSNSSDVSGGGTATGVISFDVDRDVTIDAGDKVDVELRLKFNSLNVGDEGMTVRGRMTTANADAIDAEGADDLSTTQLQGSATGEYHTLRTSGLTFGDFDAEVDVTTADTADNSYGEYTLTIEVTAIGQDDLYIPLNVAAFDDAGSTTKGAVYTVKTSAGAAVASSTADSLDASLELVSGGDESGGYVRIDSGETATLELVVTFNPGSAAGQYRVVLDGIGFATSEAPATDFEDATPESDYDSANTYISS